MENVGYCYLTYSKWFYVIFPRNEMSIIVQAIYFGKQLRKYTRERKQDMSDGKSNVVTWLATQKLGIIVGALVKVRLNEIGFCMS